MNKIDTASLQKLGLSAPQGKTKAGLGQDDFLKLMITQMSNQDPFKPLESGEFLGQMAQFSTVSGIQDLQDTFSNVASGLYSNQALQASSLVGRSVLIDSDMIALPTNHQAAGVLKLDGPASNVSVDILDSSGELVKRMKLGGNAAGMIPVSWDGTTDSGGVAKPGIYRFKAVTTENGIAYSIPTLSTGQVDSVSLGEYGQGVTLNLGMLGDVDMNKIKQIK